MIASAIELSVGWSIRGDNRNEISSHANSTTTRATHTQVPRRVTGLPDFASSSSRWRARSNATPAMINGIDTATASGCVNARKPDAIQE